MASTPRAILDDSYILGVTCAICGADALSVNHVPNLPDFVNCSVCSSAFLVEEGGDRVFYGQIAPGYQKTERFALKQWTWIEAVETRAREERPRPEGEAFDLPDPETIEEPASSEPEGESLSAEEWISSEIPMEELATELTNEQNHLQQEAPDQPDLETSSFPDIPEQEAEAPIATRTEAEALRPAQDLPDEPEPELADFFEALTDDSGDSPPAVEPEPYRSVSDTPVVADLDADLERLLDTEDDDSGPELPPPPWAAGGADEAEAEEIQIDAGAPEGSTWETFFDAEAAEDGEAVPVVDAKDETYESLPSWQNLEEATPLEQAEAEPESPAPSMVSESAPEAGDLSDTWREFESEGSFETDDATPQTPDWALPSSDEAAEPVSQFTGPDELSWGTEPVDEAAPSWQEVPGMFSEEESDEEDDFISGLRRSAAVPLESQPVDDQPLSDFSNDDDAPWDMGSDDLAARMGSIAAPDEPRERVAAGWEMTAAAAVTGAEPEPAPEPEPIPAPVLDPGEGQYTPPPTDPPPGQRHRVAIRGERVVFPSGECAHCGRTPAQGKLAVAGTLPRGQAVGQRRPTRFEVPLCADCRKRAAAKSEDASTAQLQAHLISAIIGMILVVGALALDLINPRDLRIVDLFLGLILLIVGYGGPAFFLLNRAGDYLPPVDARYVRTTLLIPSETQGLETAFEWRNSEYAQRFHDANSANVLGNVSAVKDRIA